MTVKLYQKQFSKNNIKKQFLYKVLIISHRLLTYKYKFCISIAFHKFFISHLSLTQCPLHDPITKPNPAFINKKYKHFIKWRIFISPLLLHTIPNPTTHYKTRSGFFTINIASTHHHHSGSNGADSNQQQNEAICLD